MDIDVKKLAREQYFRYFKIWFIVVGVLAAMTAVLFIGKKLEEKNKTVGRGNHSAPVERVFDQADVLTAEEEERLRQIIAEAEEQIQCDIVLVTMNQAVEGYEAQQKYSYRYDDWELNMRDLADDFYDNNNYGYDIVGGDGVLLLDNWYEGQAGSWLSTSGAVYEEFGDYEINSVLDAVYYGLDEGEYEAYKAYVDRVAAYMDPEGASLNIYGENSTFLLGAFLIPIIVAIVFIVMNLKSKEGDVTTSTVTYVANGRPRMNINSDTFIRKTVTSRRIPRNDGGGGGSSRSSSGRGGSHRSSSGRSHGGGGRRR